MKTSLIFYSVLLQGKMNQVVPLANAPHLGKAAPPKDRQREAPLEF